MKKVILAVFVSGLFISSFVSKARTPFIPGAATSVSDTDTSKKVMITDFVAANEDLRTVISDTDTTKKVMMTDLVAVNDDMRTAVSDTDTTKKVMMTDLVAVNDDALTDVRTAVSDTDTTKKIMTSDASATSDEDNRTKIDPAALPDAVKATLAGDDYKGWLIANAYLVKGTATYYEIELKKGDTKNTVKLDKDGKKI